MELTRNCVEASSESLTAERKEILEFAEKGQTARHEEMKIKMRDLATQMSATEFFRTYVSSFFGVDSVESTECGYVWSTLAV
jgi:uncharacterized membrane protein